MCVAFLVPSASAQTLTYDAPGAFTYVAPSIGDFLNVAPTYIGSDISLDIVSPAIFAYTTAYHNSTINFRGGLAQNGFIGYDNSRFNMTGGVGDHLDFYDNSTASITGGTIFGILARDSSDVTFGGTAAETKMGIGAANNAHLTITGGTITSASGTDASVLSINGGSIDQASVSGTCFFVIKGGAINDLFLGGSSKTYWYHGIISYPTIFQQSDTATITLFGKSLAFSSAMAGTDSNGNSGVFCNLSFTQSDGAIVNTRYFDINGDVNNATPQGVTFQISASAPEPGTLVLLGLALPLAGVVIGRRKGRA